MTANADFDRDLRSWLETEAPPTAPADLSYAAIDRARASRQRPRWLVTVRGGGYGGTLWRLERSAQRATYVLVLIALFLALVLAVVVVGALLSEKIKVGRNGIIAYEALDTSTRIQPSLHYSLHVVNSDGSGEHQIGLGGCPTFSRDGSVLAYVSGNLSSTELNIAQPDGSDARVIPGIGESEYALSPDGTRIAWLKTLSPINSPDGSITIGLKNELWIAPTSGGPAQRIVPASTAANEWFSALSWSPDGNRIAFASFLSFFGDKTGGAVRNAIYVVDDDGSNLATVTTRPGTDPTAISWSPDGRYLAYDGLPDGVTVPPDGLGLGVPSNSGQIDVFVVNADGTNDRNITSRPGDDHGPEWSPDGGRVAFLSIHGDLIRLATIRMEGSNPVGSALLGPVADTYSWSPDATTLLSLRTVATDPSVEPQSVESTIQSVDADFLDPPTTVLKVDHQVACQPTWQRLEP